MAGAGVGDASNGLRSVGADGATALATMITRSAPPATNAATRITPRIERRRDERP